MRRAGRPLHALLVVLAATVLASCGDDLSLSPDPASFDRVPVLEASASSLTLDQGAFSQQAVRFSWSPGSNRGSHAAIDYSLEFALADGFSSPVAIELGRGVYSRAYTVSELNRLLLERLGVSPEAATPLHVRVAAVTAGSADMHYSNAVELAATPYEPVSTTLYLLGSAAPNGWDANNASPLTPDPALPFVFVYQGSLTPGEFKFITDAGQFLPSYNRGESDTRLVYRSEDAQSDDKFVITEAGSYRVSANLVDLVLSVEQLAGPAYSELWVVGDATPNGWDIDNASPMRQDPGDPFLFDFNGVLSAGELKIASAKDWGAPFYRPIENHPDAGSSEVQLSAGDPDHKWMITEPGAYKITLDTRTMSISIEAFTSYGRLWMVGDATPNGWNIDSPTEMQADPADPFIFTYSGTLTAGEFKFPVATGDWGTDYFMPAVDAPPLESTYVRFIPGGQPDNKWRIQEAGTYTITLNQLYETIVVERR